MGINLQIRNLENRIVVALNEFDDIPIEVKRIILQGILNKINNDADIITKAELIEYEKEKHKED